MRTDRGVERDAVRVDDAVARRALAVLLAVGSTVQANGDALRPGTEALFAAELQRSTEPKDLARRLRLTPEEMAALCIRVIRARAD